MWRASPAMGETLGKHTAPCRGRAALRRTLPLACAQEFRFSQVRSLPARAGLPAMDGSRDSNRGAVGFPFGQRCHPRSAFADLIGSDVPSIPWGAGACRRRTTSRSGLILPSRTDLNFRISRLISGPSGWTAPLRERASGGTGMHAAYVSTIESYLSANTRLSGFRPATINIPTGVVSRGRRYRSGLCSLRTPRSFQTSPVQNLVRRSRAAWAG